jgi:hypothetical protein
MGKNNTKDIYTGSIPGILPRIIEKKTKWRADVMLKKD